MRMGDKLPAIWTGQHSPIHAPVEVATPGSRVSSSQAATSEADDLELPGFTLVDSIVAAIEVRRHCIGGITLGCCDMGAVMFLSP